MHPQPATYAQATALSLVPVSDTEWPLLTLYRSGLANLNGRATDLLHRHHARTVALVPPEPPKANRAAPAWQLRSNPPTGGQTLVAHGSRVGLRFRAREVARLLFAGLPAEVERLRFAIIHTPEFGDAGRFRLLPW